MIKVKQIIVYVFMFFILMNSYAFAQNAEEIVKYRKNIMKAIGSHISVIASNVKGKVVIESDIIPHAKALYLSISSINIEKTFPSSTSTNDNLKTRALPEVWEKSNEFTLNCSNVSMANPPCILIISLNLEFLKKLSAVCICSSICSHV